MRDSSEIRQKLASHSNANATILPKIANPYANANTKLHGSCNTDPISPHNSNSKQINHRFVLQ